MPQLALVSLSLFPNEANQNMRANVSDPTHKNQEIVFEQREEILFLSFSRSSAPSCREMMRKEMKKTNERRERERRRHEMMNSNKSLTVRVQGMGRRARTTRMRIFSSSCSELKRIFQAAVFPFAHSSLFTSSANPVPQFVCVIMSKLCRFQSKSLCLFLLFLPSSHSVRASRVHSLLVCI